MMCCFPFSSLLCTCLFYTTTVFNDFRAVSGIDYCVWQIQTVCVLLHARDFVLISVYMYVAPIRSSQISSLGVSKAESRIWLSRLLLLHSRLALILPGCALWCLAFFLLIERLARTTDRTPGGELCDVKGCDCSES
jgi:hypothetical protein